jgi:hypothetical protein
MDLLDRASFSNQKHNQVGDGAQNIQAKVDQCLCPLAAFGRIRDGILPNRL